MFEFEFKFKLDLLKRQSFTPYYVQIKQKQFCFKKNDNDEFKFNLDLLERQSFTPC